MSKRCDGTNAPDAFVEHREQHRALAILRILQWEESGMLNDGLLRDLLRRFAFDDDRDQIRGALDRLERDGLVEKVDGHPTVVIVRLTDLGERVADGRVVVDGVKRGGPECGYWHRGTGHKVCERLWHSLACSDAFANIRTTRSLRLQKIRMTRI